MSVSASVPYSSRRITQLRDQDDSQHDANRPSRRRTPQSQTPGLPNALRERLSGRGIHGSGGSSASSSSGSSTPSLMEGGHHSSDASSVSSTVVPPSTTESATAVINASTDASVSCSVITTRSDDIKLCLHLAIGSIGPIGTFAYFNSSEWQFLASLTLNVIVIIIYALAWVISWYQPQPNDLEW